jgi:hypothetical protein
MADSSDTLNASCSLKRIDYATVKAKYNDYLTCLGTEAVGAAAVTDASGDAALYRGEAAQLQHMGDFILRQLQREKGGGALAELGDIAQAEIDRKQGEIDDLKSEIRKERRRFMDAEPNKSPAVLGLYFTQTPDNQVLIGFLSAFGAFLVFAAVAVVLGRTPFAFLNATSESERNKLAAGIVIVPAIVAYICFYLFT